MQPSDRQRIWKVPAIILLVIAVAGLSTLAKHSRLHPESKSIHYLAQSAKMNVTDVAAFAPPVPVYTVERLTPLGLQPDGRLLVTSDELPLPQIGLTISLQHRSPPSLLGR